MAPVTVLFGILLIALGVCGYTLPDKHSPTALIPAAFGAIFVVLGILARQERLRKHVMHAAAALALLGLIAALATLLPGVASEGFTMDPAQISKSLMALLCAVLIALCVRSFIHARRNRQAN